MLKPNYLGNYHINFQEKETINPPTPNIKYMTYHHSQQKGDEIIAKPKVLMSEGSS